MTKIEKHHVDFQFSQKRLNKGKIYDDRTIPLEEDFHDKITKQVLYEGVPMITTVGEIDVDDIRKGRYPRNKDYKKR